jgi:predicted DnaQ family exonuclease/DinG family helicase
VRESSGHPHSLVAFDLETTGLSPKGDEIIEVGAVRYDDGLHKLADLEVAVDPGMPIPLAVQRLTGITDADVHGAETPQEAVAQFADFAAGATLIAHGGNFDLVFLTSLLPEQFGHRLILDTLELARILLPTQVSHSLPLLSADLGLEHARPHRALSDATATGALFTELVAIAQSLPRETVAEIRRVAAQADGPLSAFFTEWATGSSGSRGSGARARRSVTDPSHTGLGLRARGVSSGGAPRGPPPPTPTARAEDLALDEAAAELLGASGPLAANAGYELREVQTQMARAVAQALQRHRRLLVEAGTGVGKSLAYLVPLALWTQREKKRAVVATHTINLQEQLAERDLPLVQSLLPKPVSVAVLKGRSHYISLRRWQRFLAEPDVRAHEVDLDSIRFKLKLLVWLTQTTTGDRAELRLAGVDEPYWQRVASDTDDCLGSACANWGSARCFMVASRRAAADADIVVTNQALLLADSERQGQVLAPYSALVVDEAHHLEAVATQQLGARVRAIDIALVLDRLPALHGSELAAAIEQCREASRRLFGDTKGFLGEQLGGDGAVNGSVGLSEDMRRTPAFSIVLKSARHAAGVLIRAAHALQTARAGAGVQVDLLPEPGRVDDELELAAQALTGLAAEIDRVVANPRADHVAWLEMRAEQAELHDAPVSVAEALRGRIFDRVESAVLTSATLTVAGTFDFMRTRLGLGDETEELRLASPFDYLRQALCILAEGVPAYDEPEHEVVMASLIERVAERLGGHMLVLFTGYGPLKRVHALLHQRLEPLGIALLGQGIDGTRRQIQQSFLDDPRTVLLGTSSFWEGIDIPGERLRCVIIDKLPFPVPTDPLVRARSERLRDPFSQYMLPVAVIRLCQGFGRLIRSSADRGAVVLCDDRLSTRDYGARFLEALPPAAVARTSVDGVAPMVAGFVSAGAMPEGVGQSSRWSSSEIDLP